MEKKMSKPLLDRPGLMEADQRGAAQFIIDNPRCALWMMPGLGKTLATLAAIEDLCLTYGLVVVVAPKRCCNLVWPEELDKWLPGSSITQVAGLPKKRIRIIEEAEQGFLTISYELLEWAVGECPLLFAKADMIVFDESSKLKSWKSKRFKALKRVAFQIPRVVELTGTPAPNGLLGIWSQIYLLDRGAALGKYITHYKSNHFTVDYLGFTYTPKKPKRIHKRVRHLVYCLRNTQYRDMVKQIKIKTPVHTSSYKAMKNDGLVLLSSKKRNVEIIANSAASQGNKLRQLANGFIYEEIPPKKKGKKPTKIGHDVHNFKIRALKDLIDELAGQPLIVFYEFKHDRERILKAIPGIVEFQDKLVPKWNRGEISVMLMSPWSAGHGLNLQGGGHQVCWFSPPFDLEIHEQANARVARKGQKKGGVLAYYLVGKNTIDGYVLKVLEQKDAVQSDLLKALEKYLKKR